MGNGDEDVAAEVVIRPPLGERILPTAWGALALTVGGVSVVVTRGSLSRDRVEAMRVQLQRWLDGGAAGATP